MVLLYITCPDLLDEVSCWRQIFFPLCSLFYSDFFPLIFSLCFLFFDYSLCFLYFFLFPFLYFFFSLLILLVFFLLVLQFWHVSECLYLSMSLSLNASLLFFLSVSSEACLLYTIPIGLEEFGIKWSGSKHKPSSPTKLNTEGLLIHSCPLFLLNNHVYFQMNRLLMISQVHSIDRIQLSDV